MSRSIGLIAGDDQAPVEPALLAYAELRYRGTEQAWEAAEVLLPTVSGDDARMPHGWRGVVTSRISPFVAAGSGRLPTVWRTLGAP